MSYARRQLTQRSLGVADSPEDRLVGGGEGNPPFKEYGTMWTLSLDKWIDESLVPYLFFKYIQTTPEVKLAIYTRLLEKAEDQWLRVEVIRSCDPFG